MVSQWSRRSLSLPRLAIWGRSLVEAAATRLRAHTVALWHVVPKGRLTHHPMDHLLICCTEVSNATIQAKALSGRTRCRWHGGCVRSTATTNVHGRRWSCWDFVWIMARILRQVLPNTHVSLGLLLLRQIVPRYFLLRWHRRATVILHVRLTEPMIAVWIVAPVVHAATRMLTSPAVWRRRHRWQSTHRAAQTATSKSKLLVSVRRRHALYRQDVLRHEAMVGTHPSQVLHCLVQRHPILRRRWHLPTTSRQVDHKIWSELWRIGFAITSIIAIAVHHNFCLVPCAFKATARLRWDN